MDKKELSRSWFCVLNNPQELYSGEPHEIAEKVLDEWVTEHPSRTGAVAYCISADGLEHLHMVLEDSNKARFSALKSAYPKAHLEPTKGTKEQAEDYINKRGKFQEKGEQVLYIARFGEIKGNQGARKDFDIIEDLIQQGKTPNEIMDMSFSFRRYEKLIRDAYYQKRSKETPVKRDVNAFWHVGASGSGKSYTLVELTEKYGEDNVYVVTDYEHGFDKYNGQPVIFLDEFRGQMPFALFLQIFDGYKVQIPCRYSNIVALWTEVHVTSPLPPEKVYRKMVQENLDLDTIEQLMRRLDFVVYHSKDGDEYRKKQVPMSEYIDYETLKRSVEEPEPDWVKAAETGDILPL